MILDTLPNIGVYRSLSPLLAQALDILASGRLTTLPDGRHPLAGESLVALLQTYTTKPLNEGRLETHRQFMDIQAVLTGAERFGYAPLVDLLPDGPYDSERDIRFYRPHHHTELVTLRPGTFAILFPHDGHMPGLVLPAGSGQVRKVVLKVAAM